MWMALRVQPQCGDPAPQHCGCDPQPRSWCADAEEALQAEGHRLGVEACPDKQDIPAQGNGDRQPIGCELWQRRC